ncbi:MAG: flagellar protein FlaG [Deltaproteobacteria bacterium]|nr:flagellar protein FlaG [Deltaproteobacteria bacterium]MBW1796257.1 flagellar protein FlaG [Deltaproteobacteria bacterium]
MLIQPVAAERLQAGTQPIVQVKPKAEQPSPEKKEEKPDVKLLQEVLEVVQEHFNILGIGLEFAVHEPTGRIKVTVLDKETGEMIREVPPQQVLDLMAKIDEMMGILFDRWA